jgi:dephospho-CoA kinase
MLKIGITGGIGSGKSEVCKILEMLGSKVFYADDLAKDILNTDENVKRKVKKEFGGEIYSSDGLINTKRMAKSVFFDEGLKVKLENIIHPIVINNIREEFQRLENASVHLMVFVEAALIYETHVDKIFDYVVVVNASEEHCISRVMSRDDSKKEDVIKRVEAQMSPTRKMERADFVIHNNEDKHKLEEKVVFIFNLLNHIAKNKS